MQDLIKNDEINDILDVLEKMEDEVMAVSLLKEFNDKTKKLGKLITNKEENVGHAEWKVRCDDLKKEIDDLVLNIKKQQV